MTDRHPLTPADTRAALERTRPAWLALHPSELVRMNVDVPRAVGIVLRAIERLEVRHPEIDGLLGEGGLEEVRDLALAALEAHLVFTSPPPEELDEERAEATRRALFAEAAELRTALADQARVLAKRPWELVDPEAVRRLHLGRGRESLPRDLNALVRLLRAHWTAIVGKTPLTEAHLARASALVSLLPKALADERDPEKKHAADAEARVRTFSLLTIRYRRLFDAVTFLRSGKGDARALAPALYAGPGSRPKPAAKKTEATEARGDAPPAPSEAVEPAPAAQELEPRASGSKARPAGAPADAPSDAALSAARSSRAGRCSRRGARGARRRGRR